MKRSSVRISGIVKRTARSAAFPMLVLGFALAVTIPLATLVGAVPTQAQRAPAVSPRPGWLPRDVNIGGGLTAAQRATAVARLEAMERIVLKVPELAIPQGFEISPMFYGGARRLGQGQVERKDYVVEYMFTMRTFVPTMAIAGEGTDCVQISVNPTSDLGGRGTQDETGRQMGEEMRLGDPLPIATRVIEGLSPTEPSFVYVDLTPRRVRPWKFPTGEEYYKALIFDHEGQGGSKLAAARAPLAKTPYQEWIEGAEQRRKEREDLLKALAAAQPPAQVAEMRRTLEDTEREAAEQLKASEPSAQEQNRLALTLMQEQTAALRAALEALTPEQRRMPAVVDESPQGPLSTGWRRLTDRNSPTARRILSPDYDYWRARTSPVEARAIRVAMSTTLTCARPPVRAAVLKAFNTLDWAALYELLDEPR